MSMRIVKTYASASEADRAWLWYQSLDSRYAPRRVQRDAGKTLAYDFVDGAPCWQPALAWQALKAVVWDTTRQDELPAVDLRSYCQYVHDLWTEWQECPASLIHRNRQPNLPDDYFDLLLEELLSLADQLTPVRQVHGDATLLNFVQDHRGRITMIDPGHPRGLFVRELDESKMLQSLLGYDRLCTGGTTPSFGITDAPFVVRRVHQLLLATHCVRLLRHQSARDRMDLVSWAINEVMYGFCNAAL